MTYYDGLESESEAGAGMSDKIGNLMGEAEETIGKIEAWLELMRNDSMLGKDIQKLQSYAPDSLSRVLLVAVQCGRIAELGA